MFGSEILDAAVGIVFVYILVAIICTAIREGIEAWLKTRASYLEHGIRQLLHDVPGTGLAKNFFEHPLIFSLFLGEYKPPASGSTERRMRLPKGAKYPSYVPAKNFALALMDLAARGPADVDTGSEGGPIVDLTMIRANVAKLENPPVQRALLAAIDSAQGDLNKAQLNIQAWFDSAMDRVSGWYKRTTQWIIFLIGIVVAVSMNINTITIADFLYRNDGVRDALVARAATAATDSTFVSRNYEQVTTDLEKMNLPIGWSDSTIVPGGLKTPEGVTWPTAIFGWLLTALAASLGAPFWFDMLNKIMVIRSTVKPHEKSPEEASEDRQAPAQPPGAAPPPAQPPLPPAQGANPTEPPPTDSEGDVDGCDCVVDDITSDEDLPASEGGVS